MQKTYLCIDLKSFYASVEAVERGLDPLKDNLVVADASRGSGAICLAITPAMKKLGVKNRCRLFQIPDDIKYVAAKPRMKLYMKYSAEIYGIYLRYISKEDIYVYSVDECFFDITQYLVLYQITAKNFAKKIMDDIYRETGLRATAGVGSNLFLAKVALDITAKSSEDFIGILDASKFKENIWYHRPITDIWNVGPGIAKRLSRYGVYDLYGVAHMDSHILYEEFGVNARFLIDHANGIETCTIADIHNYVPQTTSISNGQILFQDYSYEDAYIVLKEMVEALVLELISKRLITDSISLYIGYSDDTIKPSGGSVKLDNYTDSLKKIIYAFTTQYRKTTNRYYPIRKLNISLNNLIGEEYLSLNLFNDYKKEDKEKKQIKTMIDIKSKYGKNSILRASSLKEKATEIERNKMVGGHNGE